MHILSEFDSCGLEFSKQGADQTVFEMISHAPHGSLGLAPGVSLRYFVLFGTLDIYRLDQKIGTVGSRQVGQELEASTFRI